jgi:hypothetical protein
MNKYSKKIKKRGGSRTNHRGGKSKRGRSRSKSKSFNTTQSHTLDFLTIFEKTIQARYIEMRKKAHNERDKENKTPKYWFYVPLDNKVNNSGNIEGKFNFLKEILKLEIESPFLKDNKKNIYEYKGSEHDYRVLSNEYVMEITKRLLTNKKIPTRRFTKHYINTFGDEYKYRETPSRYKEDKNETILPGKGINYRHRYAQDYQGYNYI